MYLQADDYIILEEETSCDYCYRLMDEGEHAIVDDSRAFCTLLCYRAFVEDEAL